MKRRAIATLLVPIALAAAMAHAQTRVPKRGLGSGIFADASLVVASMKPTSANARGMATRGWGIEGDAGLSLKRGQAATMTS
jgi:hypothetical protein